MKPGDKVKIVKGLYKGLNGVLKSRITENDTRTNERTPCWIVCVGNGLVMVYESELDE
jgi:hypothetical protein